MTDYDYDTKTGTLYIRVAPEGGGAGSVMRTLEADGNTHVDLDADGMVLGVEVLNFRERSALEQVMSWPGFPAEAVPELRAFYGSPADTRTGTDVWAREKLEMILRETEPDEFIFEVSAGTADRNGLISVYAVKNENGDQVLRRAFTDIEKIAQVVNSATVNLVPEEELWPGHAMRRWTCRRRCARLTCGLFRAGRARRDGRAS